MSVLLLADAKAVLQVAHAAQDSVIQLLLDGAEEWVERECGIALQSAERVEDLDGGRPWLLAGTRPVTALTSIVDLWNDEEEWPSVVVAQGRFARADDENRVLVPSNLSEPSMGKGGWWPEGGQRWRATYTAGFATVPAGLKMAIFQLVHRAYWARGGVQSTSAAGASMTYDELIDGQIGHMLRPYRRKPVGGVW